jgi:hypothetical protein
MVFATRELSCFLIFIPIHSGYSMNIYPITIWTSFTHRISGDLMLENNLLHQYFIEQRQLNIVGFI